MADVTGGTPPTNASPFDVPGDISDVYSHFGDGAKYTQATIAGLPASGNWIGRLCYVQEDSTLRVVTALPGTWTKVRSTEDTGEFQAVAGGVDITFGSGWSHHSGSGWSGVRLRVKNGRVTLNGAAAKSSWSASDTIATLVAAYRPATQVQGINVIVSTAGLVTAGAAGSVALSFGASWEL